MDDETYRRYVESELQVAVKNPLPQSKWGFRACSRASGLLLARRSLLAPRDAWVG